MALNSFRSSNVGAYAAFGRTASDGFNSALRAINKLTPDFTKLRQANIQAESKINVARTDTKARERIAQMKADSDEKIRKMEIDTTNELLGDKKKLQGKARKAGSLLAIGGLASGIYLGTRDNEKGRTRPEADYEGFFAEQKSKRTEIQTDGKAAIDAVPKPVYPEYEPYKFVPTKTDFSAFLPKAEGSNSTSSNSGASAAPDGVRKTVFNHLTKVRGLPRNNALGIMANIERESGFRPSIASGDDQGPGGLFQWKGSRQTPKVRQLVETGDVIGQLNHALDEPGEPYGRKYMQMQFPSAQSAADGWMTHFERPLDTRAGSIKHTDILKSYSNY